MPFYRADQGRLSRLSERPHRATRLPRTRYRFESPMADDCRRQGEGSLGTQDVRSL